MLPCSLRGNEGKEVGLGTQVGARPQGHLMDRPVDFYLHMKEVFSGFYTGDNRARGIFDFDLEDDFDGADL